VPAQIPEAFEPLFKPKRFKVYYGGRGGAKSWAFADALIIMAATNGESALCAREFQNSIEDSVHGLLTARIGILGLDDHFDIQSQAIFCRKNKAQFKYAGLSRNITSIKSKFGFKRIWIEEGESLSQRSLDVVTPTIREAGGEIWISYNPFDEAAPVHQQFVIPHLPTLAETGVYEDSLHYVRKVTFRDNPWFKETPLYLDMVSCREKNYRKYLHIWEGEPNADYEDSIIEPEWVDAAIDAHIKLNIKPIGDRVTSFDPADSGNDKKATASRHGIVVSSVLQWADGDLETGIEKAFDEAFAFRAEHLVYDSVGVGAGVRVGLSERIAGRQITVTGFGGGESPDYPKLKYKDDKSHEDVFRNKRAQYWWLLRDRFEATYRAVVKGEYIDPHQLISLSCNIKDLSQLKGELVRQQRKRTPGSTMIQLISKEEMRSKGLPSPNMADALCMVFANKEAKKPSPISIPLPSASHW